MRTILLLAAMGLTACGGNVQLPGDAGGTTGSGGSTSSSSTTTSSTSTTGGWGGACEEAADAISGMFAGSGTCTAVVRLDYPSRVIVGWQVVCGNYLQTDETSARATAQADTGQGQGQSLAGAAPMDEFVFFQSAGDFGGSAAVSARSGKSVFGGTTVWGGKGDITYPKSWLPPASLGIGCAPTNISSLEERGFDLGGGTPLDDASLKAVMGVVLNTALPSGMGKVEYLFDAMVLLYPRTVGAADPLQSEWIVLLNGGFLE